jgi:hypothetical protein
MFFGRCWMSTVGLIVIAAFSACIAGCGASAYEAKFTRTLGEMSRLTPYAALHDQPITIPETGVSLRIPRIFDQTSASYAPGGISVRDSAPDKEQVVDPKRLHPSFLKIPGLKTTYEVYVTPDKQSPMPVYMYLAVEKKQAPGSERAAALAQELSGQLKAKFNDQDPKWDDETATSPNLTPEGATKTLAWKKLAIKVNQEYDTGTPGSPSFYERNGQFELWMLDGESEIVLIGWSVPDLIGTTVNLPSLSKPVAGTVVVGADPAAAAGA